MSRVSEVYGLICLQGPRPRRMTPLGWAGVALLSLVALFSGSAQVLGAESATHRRTEQQSSTMSRDVVRWFKEEFKEGLDECARTYADAPGHSVEIEPELVDLDGRAPAEIVVTGPVCFCSPTGNCAFSIYRRSKSGYDTLLDARGVHQHRFLKTRSHGHRDLQTSMHGSATESIVFLLRFDGRRYRLRECYDRSYSYLDPKTQEVVDLEKPRVSRISCEDYEENYE